MFTVGSLFRGYVYIYISIDIYISIYLMTDTHYAIPHFFPYRLVWLDCVMAYTVTGLLGVSTVELC